MISQYTKLSRFGVDKHIRVHWILGIPISIPDHFPEYCSDFLMVKFTSDGKIKV